MSDTPETVPVEKFNKAQEQLRKAQERIAALEPLEARVKELEPFQSQAGDLAKKYETLKGEHKSVTTRYAEDLSMAEAGLTDPMGRDVARLVHGRLPEEGRPPLGDYLRGLRAEGAEVPAPLRAYFATVTPPAAGAPPKDPPPKAPNPVPPPKAPGGDGSSLLKALRDGEAHYRATRDPGPLQEALKATETARANSGGRT